MTSRPSPQPWPTAVLVLLCIGAIVAAALLVGPASGSQAPEGRVITAARGVVQSTVSGSGNVQPSSELDLGFETSGVVSQIYVHQGELVTEGKLLAELDPKSAEAALQQARANLQQAQASLLQAQETSSTSEAAAGGSATGANSSDASASAAEVRPGAAGEGSSGAKQPAGHTRAPESSSTRGSSTSGSSATGSPATGSPTTGSPTAGSSAPKTATVSPALHEADVASAKAAVTSDALAVRSAEEALADTKLYAPQSGTIVSLSGEVGETVAASGTTRASQSSSDGDAAEGGSGSGGSGASALGGGRGSSGSGSTDAGSSSTTGSSFAVLSDLSSMQLVVPLSESEVGSVRPNQSATVTVEALEGKKLAAHVVSVATLPTSDSGVVSYDVTFALDQLAGGLKPGMTASAEVVVEQAEGVNVPTSAVAGGTVTVVDNGKRTRRHVVTGLAGNSSTIVLSGLEAGEQVVLPLARTGAAGLLGGRLGSALGGRLGTGALGGGALGGGGGALGGGAIGLRGAFRGG